MWNKRDNWTYSRNISCRDIFLKQIFNPLNNYYVTPTKKLQLDIKRLLTGAFNIRFCIWTWSIVFSFTHTLKRYFLLSNYKLLKTNHTLSYFQNQIQDSTVNYCSTKKPCYNSVWQTPVFYISMRPYLSPKGEFLRELTKRSHSFEWSL